MHLESNLVMLTPRPRHKETLTFGARRRAPIPQDQSQPGTLGERPDNEPLLTHLALEFGGQLLPPPGQEANDSTATLNCYWRLFIDPRLSPLGTVAGQLLILIELFLSLTNQVQALAGMMQIITPLVPQLTQ